MEKCAQKKLKTSLTESALLEMSGYERLAKVTQHLFSGYERGRIVV
jgi:hypothetical protein